MPARFEPCVKTCWLQRKNESVGANNSLSTYDWGQKGSIAWRVTGELTQNGGSGFSPISLNGVLRCPNFECLAAANERLDFVFKGVRLLAHFVPSMRHHSIINLLMYVERTDEERGD